MKTSDQLGDIFTALSKAQAEFKVALRDSSNPFFKSNYADFQSVVEAVRPALAKHGLAFIQMPSVAENGTTLITRITHSTGQWFECAMPVKTTKDDAQALGAAITYTRRYALQAALGIVASDEDDDAEKTMDREKQDRQASKAAVTGLLKAFAGLGVTEPQIAAYLGIKEVGEMTEIDLQSLKAIGSDIKTKKSQVSDYFKGV